VVIAHRASALAAVDLVLVLNQGRQQSFDAKEKILRTVPRLTSSHLTVVPTVQAAAT